MNLFTYGVLMHPELLRELTGRRFASEPAILRDYRRPAVVKEGYPRFPAIVPAPGASVEGVLVRGIDRESFEILDRFEEVDLGLYTRESVAALDEAGRSCEAFAYVAGPRLEGCLEGTWEPTEFLDRYYETYKTRIIPAFLESS